ncbi:MAG: diacylglycerol kinase family lipid kinase [Elusimicrobia bacterium]|nr:diacylglycerol kinase family lipid kinase [Elusimicrobiota bacterium]
MSYFFIINPIAGHKNPRPYEQAIRDVFTAKGASFEIAFAQARGHAFELAQKAKKNHQTVVAVGGDGTVNETASALIGSDNLFGIIPKGSGDGLSREIGLPINNPRAACDLLFQAQALAMDAGRVGERYFFNLAGVGFDAHIARVFNSHAVRGQLAYYYLTIKEALAFQSRPVSIKINGQHLSGNYFLVAAGIGKQYGSNAKITPRAVIDDGLLDITAVSDIPLWKFFWRLPRLFRGTIDSCPEVKTFRTTSLVIEADEPLPYHLDGEPFRDAKCLEISILPKALKILVPPAYLPG